MAAMPYCPSNKMRKLEDLHIAFQKKKKKEQQRLVVLPKGWEGYIRDYSYAMHIGKYQSMIKIKAIDFQLPQ